MAVSKPGDTKDTLGTIFDFIFAEVEKPVDKRRPIKPTHVSGSSEMVDTLAAVLERPGLYVSNQAVQDLEDGLNIQLTELYLGTSAPQGKTKIGTKDILSILKDPNVFFDKAYKKANPKFNAADWSGQTFRGLNAAAWAKKQGIKDKDTLWALNRASASFDNPSARLDMVEDGRRMVRKQAAMQSVGEVCKSHGLGGVAPLIGKYIDSAENLRTPSDLEYILRTRAKITDDDLIKDIMGSYNGRSNYISGMDDKLIKGFKPKPFFGSSENIDTYRSISSQFYAERANVLRMSGTSDDEKLAQNYDKIAVLINNWRLSDKDNKKYLIENKNELKNIRRDINLLKSSGLKTTEERRRLAELQNEEKKLRSNINFLSRNRMFDSYFKYKGMWTSMNNIYIHGNLLGSIMDGTFFSDDNKILNPVETDYKGTMNYPGKITIFFNIARKDSIYKVDKKNGLIRVRNGNFYNDTMTMVSYLTPQKILQGNGELWAFLTYKNRMKVFRRLLKMSKDKKGLTDWLVKEGLFDQDGLMNFDIFGDKGKFNNAMNKLETLLKNDKLLKKYFKDNEKALKMFQKYLKMNKFLQTATNIFSARYRMQEWLKDRINDFTTKALRKRIYDTWLKKFADDKILGSAAKQWLEGGSIQVLIRGFVEKFLVKLGMESGKFIFTQLSAAISGGLSIIAFEGFKILAQIASYLLFIGLFVLIYSFAYDNSLTQTYGPTAYAAPGEVVQCEGFESEELVNTGVGDIIVPPPSNSSCPLGTASYYCTQGPYGKFSHSGMSDKRPVDIALHGSAFYFYAPQYCDDGGCRITVSRSATQYRCLDKSVYVGDEVIFNDGQGNEFILVHAKALVPVQQEVSGGEAVAYIYGAGELSDAGTCWDGSHLHLEITHNGAYIDPLPFLQAMGCSVPDTSQCRE